MSMKDKMLQELDPLELRCLSLAARGRTRDDISRETDICRKKNRTGLRVCDGETAGGQCRRGDFPRSPDGSDFITSRSDAARHHQRHDGPASAPSKPISSNRCAFLRADISVKACRAKRLCRHCASMSQIPLLNLADHRRLL